MKRIVVELDESTGNIYHKGQSTGGCIGINAVVDEPKQDLDRLKELVAAGLSADDLIKLKHGGVL